jgi:hypothetical protein
MTRPWTTFAMLAAVAGGCGGDDAGMPDAGPPSLCEAWGTPFARVWMKGTYAALRAAVDENRGVGYVGRATANLDQTSSPVSIAAHDLETGAVLWELDVGLGK